jgi:3-oxoacyl-[acyl-carrier protein] reductase
MRCTTYQEISNMSERKAAIVTGSGTGVGAAAALALARRGWNVLINYSKSEAEAREAQAACRAAGADTLLVQGDVASNDACQAMAGAAQERWQRLDALVNNAGITTFAGGGGNWDALDAEAFQRINAVNVIGTFQMVRACAPALKASGNGAIVNVSSIAGSLGIGSSVPYVASKGAVNSMTLHLARALAPEVRVNAVCPGLITTRWFVDGVGAEGYEKLKANYEQMVPLARASSAEDVAETVLWLIEGARSITGEMIQLDGGMHLGATVRIPQPPPSAAKGR